MDLDTYKIARQVQEENFVLKEVPELANYMKRRTKSVIAIIKRNLKLEIAFAVVFFVFACVMLTLFNQFFFFRLFTIFLLIFCACFVYYLLSLLRYIQLQYKLDTSINEQLAKYILIISRFTKLYFQLTMIMIPLILLTALIAGYLDQLQSGSSIVVIYPQTVWMYLGLSVAWCIIMYYVTRWYVKKLYGNHLNRLKEQLKELQGME